MDLASSSYWTLSLSTLFSDYIQCQNEYIYILYIYIYIVYNMNIIICVNLSYLLCMLHEYIINASYIYIYILEYSVTLSGWYIWGWREYTFLNLIFVNISTKNVPFTWAQQYRTLPQNYCKAGILIFAIFMGKFLKIYLSI